jgi:acid phosphatase
MRSIVFISLILLAASPVVGQDRSQPDDARYNAVLWTQNSPEYAVAVRQTYWLAKLQLAAGLDQKDHTADEVQAKAGDFEEKPPAIVLDVDETVLDNSPYNARNIEDNDSFRPQTWTPWVAEAVAPPVPGAVEFIKHARGKGVAVFLVTNRNDSHREGTLKNLRKVGLTQDDVPDNHLLLRNDDDGRGGDKVSRRAMVARDYRIVLLIGDNIADVCAGVSGNSADVAKSVAFNKQQTFGDGWVMIPNAMYGGWERSGCDSSDPVGWNRFRCSVGARTGCGNDLRVRLHSDVQPDYGSVSALRLTTGAELSLSPPDATAVQFT